MWIDFFDNGFFLKSLYPDGVSLCRVKIENFNVEDEGCRSILTFNLPVEKKIPKKWEEKKINIVVVKICFIEITDDFSCSINYNHNFFSKIEFEKENDFLKMKVTGRFNISLKCRFPSISNVSGIYDETLLEEKI